MRLAMTVNRSAESNHWNNNFRNDTLDLAKVEAGRLSLATEAFDLTTVMTETAELFTAQAHEKGIELIVAPAPLLDRRVCRRSAARTPGAAQSGRQCREVHARRGDRAAV